MPWVHLHVSTRGLVQACCLTPITYGDINQQTIKEIWEGDQINAFRKKLLEGKRDKRCNVCYRLEEAGVKSVRQETLDKYSDRIDKVLSDSSILPDSPVYFDIRFSNVCNFRCLTCWHGASSKWFKEARINNTHVSDKAIIKAIDDEAEFFKQLESMISGAEEFYFAGGEPLVMDEHYKVLDLLLSHEKTKVHLRYNTNLSVMNFKGKSVLDYWKKFEHVTVSASIDAPGKTGEIIRRDSKWEVIKINLETIKRECPHVNLEIAPTVSSLNLMILPELHRELVDEQLIAIDSIYFNILRRPAHYHIRTLNDKNQAIINLSNHIEWLIESKANLATIQKMEELIGYLKMD